jgi:hypothetical protein
MNQSTANIGLPRLCPRCHAPFEANSRFCSVCGTTRPTAPTVSRKPRRGVWLVAGSALCLALVFAAVAAIYFSAPERHAAKAVSHVAGGAPRAIALGGSSEVDYVGTSAGLLLSTDQARSWQSVPTTGDVGALAVTADGSTALWAGSNGIWRVNGTTGPTQVQRVPPAALRALAIDPRDPRRIIAASDGKTLLTSTDGGVTWSALGDNAPSGITGLTFGDPNNPAIFASTAGNGVFVSSDGRGWANANGFVNGALPTRNVFAIVFDPSSGDRYTGPSGETLTGALYAGTDQGVFKSIDAGVSWSAMPFHLPVVGLAVSPDGSHRMLAIDSNGDVYRSTDGGASWG